VLPTPQISPIPVTTTLRGAGRWFDSDIGAYLPFWFFSM
jgi:hypothetical protein